MPLELLLDNLLMIMPIESVLQLASTNKFFATLCADELLWQRRLKADFNFSDAGTARTSGWRFIYKNIYNPKGGPAPLITVQTKNLFVQSDQSSSGGTDPSPICCAHRAFSRTQNSNRENANGRLGLGNKPRKRIGGSGVPFPTRLRIPGVRIVNLNTGGMSFHALDSEGRVWVWGTLNGQIGALNSDGFSEPGKAAPTPLRLDLPSRITEVRCGRLHSLALDAKSQVWNFVNWGRPFVLASNHLLHDSKPVQVECGWNFSSLLTKSGEIFVWWPLSGRMAEQIGSKNAEMDETKEAKANASDGAIPCVPWTLEVSDLDRLPPLPRLPTLADTGDDPDERDQLKIIKIAAMDALLIALTNHGHVVLFRGLESEETLRSLGAWTYLPHFSELNSVRETPPFAASNDSTTGPGIAAPQTLKITHISAHFLKFFAYSTGSSSVVLMGSTETTEDTQPHIEPALQNKSVISVLVGDWHYAALTETGQLFTWGGYSSGALGLGDPMKIPAGAPGGFTTEEARLQAQERGFGTPQNTTQAVPTEVRFDHGRKTPKNRFCLAASASGWQTGALVIDLQDNDDEDDSEEEDVEEDEFVSGPLGQRGRGGIGHLPIAHLPFPGRGGIGGGIFRVGFAGRGAGRGRGRGQPPPSS
uniref:RCC1/BLIP-II protein n=1 Tax=Mycena chlorophos TaxID=658473 RepID=A0ABQ0L777_MYCCL|nr:RCC1/BLIP-II protein [Mycena chlorophos]